MLLEVILDQVHARLDGVVLDGPAVDARACHYGQQNVCGLRPAEQHLEASVSSAGFELGAVSEGAEWGGVGSRILCRF